MVIYLRRNWLWLTLLTAYGLSGLYFVGPDEQAVVRCFGAVWGPPREPGVHYRPPWPVSRLNKLKVHQARRVSVGFAPGDQVLGRSPTTQAEYLTGDQNLINIQMTVQYTISEPVKYLFRSQGVERLVGFAAGACLTRAVESSPVDELLTIGRVAVQNKVQYETQRLLDQYDLGVTVTLVSIENVAPPAEVAAAFREVASARGDKERIVNEAQGYANEVLAKARGEAQKLLLEAEAYRERRINQAKGDAARFAKLVREYEQAKDVTSARLYLEAMEEIWPRLRKVVVDAAEEEKAVDVTVLQTAPWAKPPEGQPAETEAPGAPSAPEGRSTTPSTGGSAQ
ncbi:MAG TPA: FtsH protease activity modulator HflK [Armatimonadetes bacterium]|nr:FtsH protease activity modulator HflK [Armatimonadota bacterium]